MVSTKKSGEELAKQKKKSTKQTASLTKKRVSTLSKLNERKPKDDKKATNGIPRAKPKPDVVLASSSSAESVEEDEDVEETREVEAKNSKVKRSEKKGKGRAVNDDSDDGEERTTCRFPLARVKRMMKNHGSDLMLSNDAVFLVNKAVERFLERFCEDAYECSVRDRKKSLGYKQLSSVVKKKSRFDFLSDYVPEKLKAEDALAERRLADTGQG